jgi:hypothetical protein
MNVFELLMFVFIISIGHFVGSVLESRMGLTGWFGGCLLGIGISILLLQLLNVVVKKFTKRQSDDEKK